MKLGRALAAALLAASVACTRPSLVAPPPPDIAPPGDSIAQDVAYLASRALRGRAAGSVGGDSASVFIARRLERLGLRGPFIAACKGKPPCRAAFFQYFNVLGGSAQNVVALIPGSDSLLASEYVVIGAHSDHIGTSVAMSMDPERGAAVRPGADDNASGTAALLELARRLSERPARRSVLIAAFDAEELGLLGSAELMAHPPIDRRSISLMVNLDMVGRLRNDRLYVEVHGPRTLAALVDSSTRAFNLRPTPTKETSGRSDHSTFVDWHIPAVALFTGFHEDYHRTGDIAMRVDFAGIRRVADVAERIVRTTADSESAAGSGRW